MTHGIVAMGASWGGLDALKIVLGGLPRTFSLPVVIVQHRSSESRDEGLVAYYQAICELAVCSIDDKQPIRPGHVYFAPSDYHVLVERDYFDLSADLPVQFSRPSVDVLFETAAAAFGDGTVGVILTGMNEDGAAGLRAIKEAGGTTIVQEPTSAERASMPLAAIAAVGEPDLVAPVDEIAPYLTKLDGEGE